MKAVRFAIRLCVVGCVSAGGAAWAQVSEEPRGGDVPVDHVPVDSAGPTFVPPLVGGAVAADGAGAGGAGGAGAAAGLAGLADDEDSALGAAAVQALEDATRFCAAVPSEYAIDCLAERLQAVARTLPTDGALGDSRKVLADTAARLNAVARSNADAGKPRQRFAAPSLPRPVESSRPLTPVAPAAQDEANAAAVAILDQAETLLLRSSATAVAAPAAPEIERMAAAIASNKVLLRSA
jgi:hypothetical protein